MSEDIALYEPQQVMLTQKQLTYIANTEFVPKAFRGNLAMIAAAIATSRAYGVPDIVGLRNIHVVEGKAELSAAMMTALVARAGHKIEGEFGEDFATAVGERADNGAKMKVTFTLEQAKKANLLGKKNWQQYAEDMLWSRAVSRLCRRLFADCFLGAVYATGELEPDDDYEETADETLDEPQDRFDSGELPLTEDEANLTPSASTDTVSPLDLLIATYGREAVARAGSELFPGRSAKALSPDELERITDRLAEPPF